MFHPIATSRPPLGLARRQAAILIHIFKLQEGSYVCWFRENQHDLLPARNFFVSIGSGLLDGFLVAVL
jgi:hypothetical protein